MGIREKLNENPAITTGVTAAIIVVALIIIGWQLFGGGGPRIPTKAYFTVDDGQTWFADDINKIPPFEHNGQQAYRVHLYTCDGGRNVFPTHLERYTDQAKAALLRAREGEQTGDMDPALYEQAEMGTEIKKARDPNARWIPQRDYERAGEIMNPICPDGTQNNIEPVYP